jgi:hypothetical protein
MVENAAWAQTILDIMRIVVDNGVLIGSFLVTITSIVVAIKAVLNGKNALGALDTVVLGIKAGKAAEAAGALTPMKTATTELNRLEPMMQEGARLIWKMARQRLDPKLNP